jgi:hypothetical protein
MALKGFKIDVVTLGVIGTVAIMGVLTVARTSLEEPLPPIQRSGCHLSDGATVVDLSAPSGVLKSIAEVDIVIAARDADPPGTYRLFAECAGKPTIKGG